MSYLITGATGYIGKELVNSIRRTNPNEIIYALVRDKEKASKLLPNNVEIFTLDLLHTDEILSLNISPDYIIHCAAITTSSEMVNHPVEVMESIVGITENVMKFSTICKPKSVIYVSSMEMYGEIECPNNSRIDESMSSYGKVDVLNKRSCYPLGKRMAENICYLYFTEYGVPVKIARLAQVFGRGILEGDNKVYSQFAKAVINNTDIVLHTDGTSMGNYCGIKDAIDGMLTILLKGENGEAYNVVNESNTMTIREMANLVSKEVAMGKIKVLYDMAETSLYGYAPKTGLRLSGQKLMNLGWKPNQSLIDMYREMINGLIEDNVN